MSTIPRIHLKLNLRESNLRECFITIAPEHQDVPLYALPLHFAAFDLLAADRALFDRASHFVTTIGKIPVAPTEKAGILQGNDVLEISCASSKRPRDSEQNHHEHLLCPICHEIYTDPVLLLASQQTFDLHCIERHLGGRHTTCPVTRISLVDNPVAVPNRTVRSLVADHLQQHPETGLELVVRTSYEMIQLGVAVRQENDVDDEEENGSEDGDVDFSLHAASENGHVDQVRLLLERGVDVDSKGETGWSPLNAAANNGHAEVVELLLDMGADMESKDNDGWSPLYAAAHFGHVEVVKLLLDMGADMESMEKNDRSPLNVAARNGRLDCVKFLLDKGADMESKAKNGRSPLFSAAHNGHVEVVKLLLDKGADMESKERNGCSPLYAAALNGHVNVVKRLLNDGADMESKDNDGWSPLYAAARFGHIDVVRLLFARGCDRETVPGSRSSRRIRGANALWYCGRKPSDSCQYRCQACSGTCGPSTGCQCRICYYISKAEGRRPHEHQQQGFVGV